MILYHTSDREIPHPVLSVGRKESGKPDKVMLEPEAPYTKRLISDVPKIHEPWDLSTVEELQKA